MSTKPIVLTQGLDVGSGATLAYEVPQGLVGVYADKWSMVNYNAGVGASVSVWFVPPGQSVADIYKVALVGINFADNYSFPELSGAFLVPGSKIYASTSSGSGNCALRISGRSVA